MDIVLLIIALLNVASAIFAWVSRYGWRNDAIQVRDVIIREKDLHIQRLTNENQLVHNISPNSIRGYFELVDQEFTQYRSTIEDEIGELQSQLGIFSSKKKDLGENTNDIDIKNKTDEIKRQIKSLRRELTQLNKNIEVTEYLITNPFYEKPNKGSVDILINWFLAHYELSNNSVPFNRSRGGFQYINGGPYEISVELKEKFQVTPIRDILLAKDVIEKIGAEWVKKGQY